MKNDLKIAEISGNDGFKGLKEEYKMVEHFIKDNLIKFLDRYFLLFLYSEMEHYFFKTLKFTILKNPKIMNGKQIKIETLLDNKNNNNLIIEEKAEDIIKDLLFKDFFVFFEILSKKPYGFTIEIDKTEINELDRFKQLRNIYIHGDGCVSLIYLSKIKDSNFQLGEKLPITEEIQVYFFRLVSKILR